MTGPSEVIVADLSTLAGLSKVRKLINNQHIDLLVNNAGFGSGGYFHERKIRNIDETTETMSDDDWEELDSQ